MLEDNNDSVNSSFYNIYLGFNASVLGTSKVIVNF